MAILCRRRKRNKQKIVLVTVVLCITTWLMLNSHITKYLDKHLGQTKGIYNIQGIFYNKIDQHPFLHVLNNGMDSQPNQVKNPQVNNTVIPASGELLAARLRDKCSTYLTQQTQRKATFAITTNAKYKTFFCPMCKLASTYWTRFFKLLEVYDKKEEISTPYDIAIKDAAPTRERLQLNKGAKNLQYKDYYKFVFVRDPYARILSAFVDKLFAPNPFFWKGLSKSVIIRIRKTRSPTPCSSDLKFSEYVRAINMAHRRPFDMGCVDCHDQTFIGACHPCEVQYDYIGKMENFAKDSKHIYQKFNLHRSIEELQIQGKQLADDDALNDTVKSPFAWKSDIKKCISWHEALNRIWKKLQIRGVIGKQPLPLNSQEAEDISQQDFLDLIKRTQKLTSYEERKKQRVEALIEIYNTVDKAELQQLKVSYQNDFHLFEYDDSPTLIFNTSKSDIKYYGYLDL